MLGKLIKYEMKATGRILLPIYSAVIIMGIISSLFIRTRPDFTWNNKFIMLTALISIVLFIALIIASLVLSFVISIYRYKQNLLGSEGYLMNTLPVAVWQNIAAKLTSAVIYQLLSIAVSLIAGFLFLVVGNNIMISEIFNAFKDFFRFLIMYNNADMWLLIIEILFLIIVTTAASNMMVYSAISIGHSKNNHKVLNSVGVYIIFYIAGQFINTILITFGGSLFDNLLTGINLTDSLPHIFITGICLLELAYGIVYFAIANYFMKNKLNLQ